MRIYPLLSLLIFFSATAFTPSTGLLELTVVNVKGDQGRIWVGIYESEADFLDREKARLIEMKVDKAGKMVIPIQELQFGEDYALAIFHDVNDNGELDTNFLGLPKEPWAFSGEPKTRLRLPQFKEVNFTFDQRSAKQVVRLRKW
ncbi:MAG: DUF2141 domain-containing protein [Bacteroidota bacterium]